MPWRRDRNIAKIFFSWTQEQLSKNLEKPRLELNDNNYTKFMKISSTSKTKVEEAMVTTEETQESWSSPDKMPLVKRLLRDGLEPRFLLTQLLWQTRLALRSVLTTHGLQYVHRGRHRLTHIHIPLVIFLKKSSRKNVFLMGKLLLWSGKFIYFFSSLLLHGNLCWNYIFFVLTIMNILPI